MRLYVESNFVLEAALNQEEAPDVDELLAKARRQEIVLCVPQFALCEPFTTVEARSRERGQLVEVMAEPLQQLGRSAHHRAVAEQTAAAMEAFNTTGKVDMVRLEEVLQGLMAVAWLIPTSEHVLSLAFRYRDELGFARLQDAIILSSVIVDLDREPPPAAAFATKDRDFQDRAVKAELGARKCVLKPTFAAALGYLGGPPTGRPTT